MHLSDSQLLKSRRVQKSAAKQVAAKQSKASEAPVCLLTTCHPERALSRALTHHLGEEMPDISFILRATKGVSAVWICGYEPGAEDLIGLIRSRYPEALLLVTGRGNPAGWRDEVIGAGADHAASWPIPYDHLSHLLHGRRKAV